jgi:DNA repair protein RecO (recombination protein O)
MNIRERVRSTHALVLRRRDVNDADRVLTVLTPHEGKVELLAKGVRKTTSRKAGHVELFTHVTLVVAQARTWHLITEAATVESFRRLREDLDAIAAASYVAELLDNFTDANDDNQPLWDLALFALRTLDEAAGALPDEAPNLLRWFDLQMLSLTGFQPQFFHCLSCEEPLQPETNYFSLEDGGVFCPRCGGERDGVESIPPDTLKVLRYLQSQSYATVARLQVRPPIARGVDNLLHRYMARVLERHLRSPDFLRRLEAMARSAPAA